MLCLIGTTFGAYCVLEQVSMLEREQPVLDLSIAKSAPNLVP